MRALLAWIAILVVIVGGLIWGVMGLLSIDAFEYALRSLVTNANQRLLIVRVSQVVIGLASLALVYMLLRGTVAVAPRRRQAFPASRAESGSFTYEDIMSYVGKIRNPVGVSFLCFITLGIYFVYWHYKVNEEMFWYDDRLEGSPSIAAIAVSLGWFLLFIPSFDSVYHTIARSQQMFKDCNQDIKVSSSLAMFLHAVPALGFPMLAPFYPSYLQAKLNRFWHLEAEAMTTPPEEERAA
ncbi:MAG: DUF4234 domain-containing protein [Candidatus Aquicultorales bacterium]